MKRTLPMPPQHICGILAAIFAAAFFGFANFSDAADRNTTKPVAPPSAAVARQLSDAFAWASDHVKPAVVTIRRAPSSPTAAAQPEKNPEDEAPPSRPGQPPRVPERQGLGSGVIVSDDGYIVTNYHVVRDASNLKVNIAGDWRKSYDAKIIGSDPRTDLAVLKIDGRNFPFAVLGDSEKLRVGDWVVAIGVPFGLSQTVTAGIISAKNRSRPGSADYVELLQTDCAINPGNSGGPLINLDGEVVGINSSITSRSGGFEGIGFSIPSNAVKALLPTLMSGGKVQRGYLGAQLQDVTEELAKRYKLTVAAGVLLANVIKDGPSEKAGLKGGDIVTSFNNQAVENVSQFRSLVGFTKPGTRVPVKVIRDGRPLVITMELGELPDPVTPPQTPTPSPPRRAGIGVTVEDLTPELANKYGYLPMEAPVITRVDAGSVAANAGLKEGDVITAVNQQFVKSKNEFQKAVSEAKDSLRLQVKSKLGTRIVVVKI